MLWIFSLHIYFFHSFSQDLQHSISLEWLLLERFCSVLPRGAFPFFLDSLSLLAMAQKILYFSPPLSIIGCQILKLTMVKEFSWSFFFTLCCSFFNISQAAYLPKGFLLLTMNKHNTIKTASRWRKTSQSAREHLCKDYSHFLENLLIL